jgi:hypothetical protein
VDIVDTAPLAVSTRSHARDSKAAAPSLGWDHVRGVVALRHEQIQAADDLVSRRYAWRGYRLGSDERAVAAPIVTLLAQKDDEVVGTLTVRPGGREPLLAEDVYALEIAQLRAGGRRVGEIIRLAIEQGTDWRAALEALVQSAYVVTRFMHGLTDVVIEVNPRHVRFYQRVFGFVTAAAERVCSRVGAPSVLMLLDLDQFGRRMQSIKL